MSAEVIFAIVMATLAIIANMIALHKLNRDQQHHDEQMRHSLAKLDAIDRRRLSVIESTS